MTGSVAEAKQRGSRIWRIVAWALVFVILVALCVYTWRGQFVKPPKTGPHVSAVQVKNDTGSARDIQVEGDGARLMSIRLENGKSCLLLFSPPASAQAAEGKFKVRAFLVNDHASSDMTAHVFSLVSLDYQKDSVLFGSSALGDWTMPKGSRMFYFRDAAYKEIDVHISPDLGEGSN
jgi:hypothetical protein